jgi:hypothetical protein
MREPNSRVSNQQQQHPVVVGGDDDGKEYLVGSAIESYWNLLNSIL